MSNVASLELCKELFELSGWSYHETDKTWCHGHLKNKGAIDTREVHEHLPAYDLGYLFRKVKSGARIEKTFEGYRAIMQPIYGIPEDPPYKGRIGWEAETPEDALAMYLIEMIQKGFINVEAK